MRPTGNAEHYEKRRLAAIALIEKGERPSDVARRLGVRDRSVYRWREIHRRHGIKGLIATPNTGRPPRLTASQKKQLEKCLLKGAQVNGFSTPLWTCPRIRSVIKKRFKIDYHVDHVWRLLQSLGWSPQKPERRARERDERAIRRWVKIDWPHLKKKRPR